ncbi:enoyl-CoA hydratase/isomerase family protein [Nocardia sp. NPDC050175]|uniref:enoyl-CoA hydratase/isomerase family protein n=1 Tax=Nocardia sp. NPDC050175 TaxID=3364317 RepID=UPI0037A473AA
MPVVEYDVKDDIAYVRMNRPDRGNGFDQEVADTLLEVVTRIANDAGLRAVSISGNGKTFSVGGDINAFTAATPEQLPETLTRMAGPYHEALRMLAHLDVPIVTAVHGACAGGGLGLLYVADIALAAEGTKFATGFGLIGIPGDGANSWYLPRLVGVRHAAEMYFENRVIHADTAAEWGLVTRVVSKAKIFDEADAVVRKLAAGPTKCYGAMRTLLLDSWRNTVGEQLSAETDALRRIAATADAPAAMASFLAKRTPTFEGK